jgi:hypothetical protein
VLFANGVALGKALPPALSLRLGVSNNSAPKYTLDAPKGAHATGATLSLTPDELVGPENLDVSG